jgi:hypothetical protein
MARSAIGDRQRLEFTLPLDTDLNGSAAAGRLMELSGRGVKIRSRALITTLWARLALGDLFLHGIGGAKYDQVTDGLIVRFFGLEPPGYMVLSATLHLPVDRPPQPVADERSIHRQLRELDFHPERHLDRARQPAELGNPEPLVAEKLHWIRTAQTPANARERYVALRRVNQALQPWVARQREHLIEESHRRREAAQQEKILGWREYAFCLYPEQPLRDFLFSQLPS